MPSAGDHVWLCFAAYFLVANSVKLGFAVWTQNCNGYMIRYLIGKYPDVCWLGAGNMKCWRCLFFLFYSGVYRVGAWVPAVAWTCGTCPWQYLVFAPFLRFASFNCLSSPRTLKRQPYLPPFTLSVEWWSFWECITFTCGLPDEAHSGKSGKSLIEFGQ